MTYDAKVVLNLGFNLRSVRDVPESNFTVEPTDSRLDMFRRIFKCCSDVVGMKEFFVRHFSQPVLEFRFRRPTVRAKRSVCWS